jgi:hypothetical protein
VTTQAVTKEQARAEAAYALQKQIIELTIQGREVLWRLSEALYRFEEMRGWLALGFQTRTEWLEDADVTLTRGTYERRVKTWQRLVVERSVKPERLYQLDHSKADIVVGSIVEGKVLIEDALADVQVMPARELRAKYLGATPNVGHDESPANGQVVPLSDEDACWLEVEQALSSNAEYPRIKRDVLVTLLALYKRQSNAPS